MPHTTVRFSRRLALALALVGLLVGCKKADSGDDQAPAPPDHTPHWSSEFAHPIIAGIEPGVTSEADLVARYPTARVDKDRSLGGDMTAMINGEPLVMVTVPDNIVEGATRLEFRLVPDAAGTPRLRELDFVIEGSSCEWLTSTFGAIDDAHTCSGTGRPTGEDFFCLGSMDGSRRVEVDCQPSRTGVRIAYRLK